MSTAVSGTPAASSQNQSIWWLFLLQGIMAVILGLMFLTAPGATLMALAAFLGFYWRITGILALVRVFVDRSVPWIWSLLVGILGILAGRFVLHHPLLAAITVPTALVIVLGVQGLIMGVLDIMEDSREVVSARSRSGRSTLWSGYCSLARRWRQRSRCRSYSECCWSSRALRSSYGRSALKLELRVLPS
jgi:uncharacterized membrane protein HdeD (DUF308 family)